MALMDVLLDEMRDLYSAENQLVKALPKVVKGTSDASMKAGLRTTWKRPRTRCCACAKPSVTWARSPPASTAAAWKAASKSATDALEKDEKGANKDLGIVGAAGRVEHYEIAGYTAAIALAKGLGLKEVASLLDENLKEEVAAAKAVYAVMKPLLKQAASEDDAHEEEDEKKPKTAKEKKSEKESEDDEKEAAPEVSKK